MVMRAGLFFLRTPMSKISDPEGDKVAFLRLTISYVAPIAETNVEELLERLRETGSAIVLDAVIEKQPRSFQHA
jgi:hypothetical protein